MHCRSWFIWVCRWVLPLLCGGRRVGAGRVEGLLQVCLAKCWSCAHSSGFCCHRLCAASLLFVLLEVGSVECCGRLVAWFWLSPLCDRYACWYVPLFLHLCSEALFINTFSSCVQWLCGARFCCGLVFWRTCWPVSADAGLPSVSTTVLCCVACHMRAFRRMWSRLRLFRRLLPLAHWSLFQSAYWSDLHPELLFLDGDSRESWPRVLHFFDVFGPFLVDALLFPIVAKVWPCMVALSSSFCFLQFSLIVTKSQWLSLNSFNTRISSWILSFACQRTCVLLRHRDCDRVLVFAVESLLVVWFVVLSVGSSVVGLPCWLWLRRGAERHISVRYIELSTWALLPWQDAGVVVGCRGGLFVIWLLWLWYRAKYGLLRSDNQCAGFLRVGSWSWWVAVRDAGWNVSISFALAGKSWWLCGCDVESRWSPSLRQPMCWSLAPIRHRVGGAVLALALGRVVVMLIGTTACAVLYDSLPPPLHGRLLAIWRVLACVAPCLLFTACNPPYFFFFFNHPLTLRFRPCGVGIPFYGSSLCRLPFFPLLPFLLSVTCCLAHEDLGEVNGHLTVNVALCIPKLLVDASFPTRSPGGIVLVCSLTQLRAGEVSSGSCSCLISCWTSRKRRLLGLKCMRFVWSGFWDVSWCLHRSSLLVGGAFVLSPYGWCCLPNLLYGGAAFSSSFFWASFSSSFSFFPMRAPQRQRRKFAAHLLGSSWPAPAPRDLSSRVPQCKLWQVETSRGRPTSALQSCGLACSPSSEGSRLDEGSQSQTICALSSPGRPSPSSATSISGGGRPATTAFKVCFPPSVAWDRVATNSFIGSQRVHAQPLLWPGTHKTQSTPDTHRPFVVCAQHQCVSRVSVLEEGEWDRSREAVAKGLLSPSWLHPGPISRLPPSAGAVAFGRSMALCRSWTVASSSIPICDRMRQSTPDELARDRLWLWRRLSLEMHACCPSATALWRSVPSPHWNVDTSSSRSMMSNDLQQQRKAEQQHRDHLSEVPCTKGVQQASCRGSTRNVMEKCSRKH